MRDDRPTPPDPDRRTDPGLQFDPASGRMRLATFTVDLPPGSDNRAVLNAYVELAARSRGDRVANLIDVRQADVDALADALDLDADDLAAEVQHVLGATRAEAVRLVSRLRDSRVIGGIAKAATGAVLAGTLLAGAAAISSATPPTTPASPAASESPDPVIDGPLTEDEDGVGLIPPVTEDADGVVLIPPASVDRDEPGGS